MKLPPVKIKSNDFPADQKKMADSLGGILNPFIDELVRGFNKNLSVEENLPFEFVTLDTRVDESGTPLINNRVRTSLKNFKGYICVNLIELKNSDLGVGEFLTDELGAILVTEAEENLGTDTSGVFPSATPFLTVQVTGNDCLIRNIAGLRPRVNYRLILLGIS
jgi:hypothetical protein